jgi:sodium/hydrogen antiporter
MSRTIMGSIDHNVADTYAIWLLVASFVLVFVALTSVLIKKLPLSYAIIYLGVGVWLGPTGINLVHWSPIEHSKIFLRLTELAVIISLFASGILIGKPLFWKFWQTPIRLLLIAMPLTIAAIALLGWYLLALPLGVAILLGAILAPTDPVLASDVQVESDEDRSELRFGLTAEAGLNDGLAFPFISLGLLIISGQFSKEAWHWALTDVLWAVPGGLLIGYGIAYGVGRAVVYVRRKAELNPSLEAFAGVGLTLGTYALADMLGAWGFLSAFAAGVAIGKVERDAARTARTPREKKAPLGALHNINIQLERLGEIACMLLLGGLLRWEFLLAHLYEGLLVTVGLLFIIRPLSTFISMIGSSMDHLVRMLAGWFGIRGIGSLYYLSFAIVMGLPIEFAERLMWIVFIVVTISVIAHGVTATPLMNWYHRMSLERQKGAWVRLAPEEKV